MTMEIEDFRREYLSGGLQREDLRDDPIEQFETWLAQAVAGGIEDPTAMSVATVEEGGRPWQRLVLLKDFGHQGFVFYTNLGRRKAEAIAKNPEVNLLFPWNVLERQVILGGVADPGGAWDQHAAGPVAGDERRTGPDRSHR